MEGLSTGTPPGMSNEIRITMKHFHELRIDVIKDICTKRVVDRVSIPSSDMLNLSPLKSMYPHIPTSRQP